MPKTITAPTEGQLFLDYDASWKKYELMLEYYAGRRVRVTYDREVLEVLTISHENESVKDLVYALLVNLLQETETEYHTAGSMTFRREDLDRGLEPDFCIWIANEPAMRHVREYNPEEHPPPDIALEVEVTRTVMDRLGIYAALGVPEVWRWDGEQIVYCLLRRGRYVVSATSTSFPTLSAAELTRFVTSPTGLGRMRLCLAFRAWVRQQIAAGWPSAPARPRRKPR